MRGQAYGIIFKKDKSCIGSIGGGVFSRAVILHGTGTGRGKRGGELSGGGSGDLSAGLRRVAGEKRGCADPKGGGAGIQGASRRLSVEYFRKALGRRQVV